MPDLNPALQRLGDGMRRHGATIRTVQWAVVLFYAVLLVLPAMLPLPDSQAHLLDNLTLLAQFLFWGSGGRSCCCLSSCSAGSGVACCVPKAP